MTRKPLSKREQQIMSIYWNAGKPLSSTGVVKIDPTLSKNTVQATVKKLLGEGLLKVADIGFSGTVLTRLYEPAIDQSDWLMQDLPANALSKIASSFISDTDDLDTLNQLSELIQKQKRVIGSK
jgi:predicted transcriptional regulator